MSWSCGARSLYCSFENERSPLQMVTMSQLGIAVALFLHLEINT